MTGANEMCDRSSKDEANDAAVSQIGGHLEISVDAVTERDWGRLEYEIEDLLRKSAFDGYGTVSTRVSLGDGRESATKVPHFGHSINCDDVSCEHRRENEEVFRLFNADVTVAGDASHEVFGTYKIGDGIRFRVSSVGRDEPGANERERV